jgi:diacylglycerol kinase
MRNKRIFYLKFCTRKFLFSCHLKLSFCKKNIETFFWNFESFFSFWKNMQKKMFLTWQACCNTFRTCLTFRQLRWLRLLLVWMMLLSLSNMNTHFQEKRDEFKERSKSEKEAARKGENKSNQKNFISWQIEC